jgi:hypothetical protein
MTIERNGRKKRQDLRAELAGYLIQMQIGQQLPSIRQLASQYHSSIGAVSLALNSLEDADAVHIQKRGHLGSQITDISVARLWNVVEQKPLVIALTLPMHSRFHGLATGLKMEFDKAGIEAYLIFIRGSSTRLKALRDDRCHAAVTSGLAAHELKGEDEDVLLTLPPGSWVSGYSVFYRPDIPTNRPMRVGVDPESYDHRRLSELEFAGTPYELRKTTYVQLARLMNSGDVDATIWTKDQGEQFAGPNILNRPLSEQVRKVAGDASLCACLVGHKNHHALRAVLNAAVDPQKVMHIQAEVVADRMIPEY